MGGSDCITYFSKNKLRKKENPCNRCSATVTGVHLFYQHMTIYDNPNAILQVGDGFGFIICFENVL